MCAGPPRKPGMRQIAILLEWFVADRAFRTRVIAEHAVVCGDAVLANEVALLTGFAPLEFLVFAAGVADAFHSVSIFVFRVGLTTVQGGYFPLIR